MSLEDAIRELDFAPGTDISNAATSAISVVRKYMVSVQDMHKLENREQENKILMALLNRFFDYADSWSFLARQSGQGKKEHENAPRLKQIAGAAVRDIQANIHRFAKSYMHIGRCLGVVNEEIEKYDRGTAGEQRASSFIWTSDTNDVLRRFHKERLILKTQGEKLRIARPTLKAADTQLAALEEAAKKVIDDAGVEEVLRGLRTNLRKGDFEKAKKSVKRFEEMKRKFSLDKTAQAKAVAEVIKLGDKYIALLQGAVENISNDEGRLFLSDTEASIMIGTLDKELDQKEKYIRKYRAPYMEAKRKALIKLREKLLVLGTLDGLITLYMKLIRGLAEPMTDIKQVREYEANVIEHVNFILSSHFQEVENVERRTDEALQEFFDTLAEFAAMDENQEGAKQ